MGAYTIGTCAKDNCDRKAHTVVIAASPEGKMGVMYLCKTHSAPMLNSFEQNPNIQTSVARELLSD